MDVAVFTSDLQAEGWLMEMENTSAKMSPIARQANADKLFIYLLKIPHHKSET